MLFLKVTKLKCMAIWLDSAWSLLEHEDMKQSDEMNRFAKFLKQQNEIEEATRALYRKKQILQDLKFIAVQLNEKSSELEFTGIATTTSSICGSFVSSESSCYDVFSQLRNLVDLTIKPPLFGMLSSAVTFVESLKILDLCYTGLSAFHPQISNLQNLTILRASK